MKKVVCHFYFLNNVILQYSERWYIVKHQNYCIKDVNLYVWLNFWCLLPLNHCFGFKRNGESNYILLLYYNAKLQYSEYIFKILKMLWDSIHFFVHTFLFLTIFSVLLNLDPYSSGRGPMVSSKNWCQNYIFILFQRKSSIFRNYRQIQHWLQPN